MATRVLAILALFVLIGCVEWTSYFYPANHVAPRTGTLTGRILGHGIAEVTMPNGGFLEGQYSIVSGDAVGSTLRRFGAEVGTGLFMGVSAGGAGEMDTRGPYGGTSIRATRSEKGFPGSTEIWLTMRAERGGQLAWEGPCPKICADG